MQSEYGGNFNYTLTNLSFQPYNLKPIGKLLSSFSRFMKLMSQGVCMLPWKVLGLGDDNSEFINTLKVYCP